MKYESKPVLKFVTRELLIISSKHNDAATDFEWMAENTFVTMLKLCSGDGYKQVYAVCDDGTESPRLGARNDEGSVKDLQIPDGWDKLRIEITENQYGTFFTSAEAHGTEKFYAKHHDGTKIDDYMIEAGERIVGIKGCSFVEKNNTFKRLVLVLRKTL